MLHNCGAFLDERFLLGKNSRLSSHLGYIRSQFLSFNSSHCALFRAPHKSSAAQLSTTEQLETHAPEQLTGVATGLESVYSQFGRCY